MCGICGALRHDIGNDQLLATGVAAPYRLLADGEPMQQGDEFTTDHGATWKPVASEFIGQPWVRGGMNPVRRATP